MKTTYLAFIFICVLSKLNAQKNVAGEYFLHGVTEIASGFKLNADSTFNFFFSYGALDRYGSGIWSINNNNIIFKSAPIPGKDFKIAGSITSTNKFSTIKLEDKNTDLYRLIYCKVVSDGKDSILEFDETGTINLPFAADSIIFLSELCSERFSSFALKKSPMIYRFNIQPWILEVFFNQTTFHYMNNYFEGRHPLLDEKTYRFEKESN